MNSVFRHEYARTIFKHGYIMQNMGKVIHGRNVTESGEAMRKLFVPPKEFYPASSEDSFGDSRMI